MLGSMTYPDNVDVYEHGIVVPDGEQPPAGLAIIATTRLPIYNEFTLTLVDRDGSSLNERAIHALDVPGPHGVADYYEESDVRFFLRESLYHLNSVINYYVRACRIFDEYHGYWEGPQSGNTGDARVLFEVDAYLGAARRVYEAISKVLWKHFSGSPDGKGRWSSMRKTVAAIESGSTHIPEPIAATVASSWNTYGVTLADYRNYVAHTGALSASEVCWMSRFSRRWGASVALLENPEDKKRAPIDPDVRRDALAYSYDVATHLVGLCEDLTAVPAIADYLANPPGYGGRPESVRGQNG